MSMIKIENLTFAYPSSYENIFENVNLTLDTTWKLGFVGRNGRGKTTLLKLLLGEYEYSGKIISSVKFNYFPFEVKNKNEMAINVLKKVCPHAKEWEIIRELSYLFVDKDLLFRSFDKLSGGEQTKILLAGLFLNPGHFFLFDEPTNHLDSYTREVIAKYLKRKNGFIIVSHDRYLLDECVDHILSINKTNIQLQKGNLSSFLINFDRQQQFEQTQNERLKKDIEYLKKAAQLNSTWSFKVEKTKGTRSSGVKLDKGYVGHKAAKMMKRAKSAQARQNKAIEQKSKLLRNVETNEQLKLTPLQYHNQILASVSNVSIYYGKNFVCGPLNFSIERGERIAIDGKNGSGKSSLLKLLMREKIDYTGQLKLGSNLIISYVPQDTSNLIGSLKNLCCQCEIDESLFKAILRKMDFERAQFEKDMEDFSQGQKKKVLIAKSLCQKSHLYVWDEPLNYIDIYSRIQIEELIKKFCPTLIFVEHDKFFRQNVATKIISI